MNKIKLLFGSFIILTGAFFISQQALASNALIEADQYLQKTSAGDDFYAFQEKTDDLGLTHIRYSQTYQGVPVFGGQRIVHLGNDSRFSSVSGEFLNDINLDTTPAFSQADAEAKALQLWQEQFKTDAYDKLESKLYVFNKETVTNRKEDNQNYLVWRVKIFKEKYPPLHEYYFIDAHTGELVHQITGMQSAINRRIYDCSINLWLGYPWLGNCYIDTLYMGYTYGRSEGAPARGVEPLYYFTADTDNLYDYLGGNFSYYSAKYSLNGANGEGGMGDDSSSVFAKANTVGVTYIDHYTEEYDGCPNAYFNGENSVHFCAGYVVGDVTGHEYAHAVDYFTVLSDAGQPSGLTYSGESGAMNEGNSDIFGEAFEYYYTGSSDWISGSDMDSPSRNMANPPALSYTLDGNTVPYPDRFNSDDFYCGEGDNNGVHVNSTVPGKGAYLMAMGGTFNGCTITGIGRTKEEAIFYRAQANYYTPSTDFNAAYTSVLQSCYDLYGYSSDCRQVKKALMAVEMDQAGACSGEEGTTPDCDAVDSPAVVSNVTSPKKNGYYKAGTKIKINVNFSKPITSSGDVKVKLETGKTDRKCKFTISSSTQGTCRYRVRKGDKSKDLNVKKITGTLTDEDGLTLTSDDLKPVKNLKKKKNLVIDTKKPKVPTSLYIYDSKNGNPITVVNPVVYRDTLVNASATPYFIWTKGRDNPAGVSRYYMSFTDKEITKVKQLFKSKYKQKKKNLQGYTAEKNKTYYLYMVMKDRAGNKSKLYTILKYQAQ
ncbi:MAG: M4 family metallopeptidase [Patescibacteria group bacterium]